MKFKDLLLPLGLTLLTMVFIQRYFFSGDNTNQNPGVVQSGQSFTAPVSTQAAKPLNREIDFIDEKRLYKEVSTEIETDQAVYVFSNDGASLKRLEIKRKINGKIGRINTVFPVGQNERENKCFLLVLEEKTPYYYELAGTDETDSEVHVRYKYQSPANDVIVNKTYTIFKETHKLNLTVEVVPKRVTEEGVQARLFYPSPCTPEIPGGPNAVTVNQKGSVVRTAGCKIKEQEGWYQPTLFGSDNKYFLHVLVEDPNTFAQRAYFRGPSPDKIFSILEGPTVQEKTSWTVSFYFGPKEEKAMALVDPRLEQTLDYSGLLAPISKVLLAILIFLYGYVGNYGLAIILLTILIRLLLLPFTLRAEQSSKKQKEMQKKMKYLEQKYKHDKELLAQEKLALMKKHGMPGLGGCLPVLFQFPIFFALSRVLSSSIEFYGAPFLWISDLSAKDPYYILPTLMVGAIVIQALTGDKNMRTPLLVVAAVIGSVAINMAAGLGLYIAASTLLGIAQTTLTKKLKAS